MHKGTLAVERHLNKVITTDPIKPCIRHGVHSLHLLPTCAWSRDTSRQNFSRQRPSEPACLGGAVGSVMLRAAWLR